MMTKRAAYVLEDNLVEGLRHQELPVLPVEYHSEGSPAP